MTEEIRYDHKPGDRIGDIWTLISGLGKGANGEVWRAQHDDGRVLALKLSWNKREKVRGKRFRDEVDTHLRIDGHPGILRMYDHVLPPNPTARDPSWLAMPEATPIRDKVGRPPQLELVVDAAAQIADTLAWLAQQGIFHRDIKPDNLYWYEGNWVIGDLGLVTFPEKEPITTQSSPAGPANLFPRELLQDPEHADPGPVDVYLLAKTLWLLATGFRWPPLGPQRVGMPYESIEYEAPMPHPRARQIDHLIQRATDNDPTKRPTMAEFAASLKLWLAPTPAVSETTIDVSQLVAEARALLEPNTRQDQLHQQWYHQATTVLRKFDQRVQPFLRKMQAQGLAVTSSLNSNSVAERNRSRDLNDQLFNHPARRLDLIGTGGRTIFNGNNHHYDVSVAGAYGGHPLLCGVSITFFTDGYANLLAGHYIRAGQRPGLYWWDRRAFYLGSVQEDEAITALAEEFMTNFPAAFNMLVKVMQTPTMRLPDLFPPPDPQQEQQRRQMEQRLKQAVHQISRPLENLPNLSGQILLAGNMLSLCGQAPKADTSTLVWSTGATVYRTDPKTEVRLEAGFGAELYDDNQFYLVAAIIVSNQGGPLRETPWSRKIIIPYDPRSVEQITDEFTIDLNTKLPAALKRFRELVATQEGRTV